jgi:PPM family protein phosphatase
MGLRAIDGGEPELVASGECRLFVEQDLLDSTRFSVGSGEVALYSRRSPSGGSPNEDAAIVIGAGDDAVVLAVADGLGGAPAGHKASSIAVSCLAEAVQTALRDAREIRTGILDGFDRANAEVLALGVGAGTTLTVAEVNRASVRAYHVGDSFFLLTGNRGKVKAQTISHSPVGYGIESGLLDAEGAMRHHERHFVSNVIGSADMHIEVGSFVDLGLRDTLVVGSDGLSDNLRTEEIVDCVRKGGLDEACRALASRARERMESGSETAPSKPDDLTFLVYRPRSAASTRRRNEGGSKAGKRYSSPSIDSKS